MTGHDGVAAGQLLLCFCGLLVGWNHSGHSAQCVLTVVYKPVSMPCMPLCQTPASLILSLCARCAHYCVVVIHDVLLCWLLFVQVEQQGDPMTITITGPKGSAEMCKQEITALINDPYPLGPGEEDGVDQQVVSTWGAHNCCSRTASATAHTAFAAAAGSAQCSALVGSSVLLRLLVDLRVHRWPRTTAAACAPVRFETPLLVPPS